VRIKLLSLQIPVCIIGEGALEEDGTTSASQHIPAPGDRQNAEGRNTRS